MAKIVFLAHRIPYPPNKGDKIRSWHFLQHLASHHEVHLACFIDDPADRVHIPFLETVCASVCAIERSSIKGKLYGLMGLLRGTSITRASYASQKMADYVKGHSAAADMIFCFSLGVYQFAEDAPCPVLLDMVDVDSAKWEKYGAISAFPLASIYKREGRILKAEENKAMQEAALTALVSEDEAALACARREAGRGGSVIALKNGVDADHFDPAAADMAKAKPVDLIFTGAMDYLPNVEAVCWFTEAVLPLVQEKLPSVSMAIVGGRPSPEVQKLAQLRGVTVTGFVDQSRDWIASSKVVVAPMLTARGIQNKVLEGMAMAKPVVATHDAYSGIEAPTSAGLFVVDQPEQMAAQIITLLQDQVLAAKAGQAARTWVKDHFAWGAVYQQLDQQVAQLLKTKKEGAA